ncbi:hypothetical protein HYQ44_013974 [Verticillium longisporum]|nr:hypothetical protein HYQ44_013974 [Verticillium longisporum]
MDDPTRYHGTLVSLEGPVDVLATQLRLLPTSPQIFILPQVQTYLEDGDPSERFDARSFVRRMHNAIAARNEIAYSFLKDSTPDNKRLVFMNGSTPGAQAICIKTIAEHETDGDIAHAELLFNDIVKHGAAGLEDDWFSRQRQDRHHIPAEDPIVRAMRAAEALDRLTADLQPNTDVDLTFKARPRSMSLPIYSFDDRFGDAAPFYVFGVISSEDDEYIDDNAEDFRSPEHPFRPVLPFTEDLVIKIQDGADDSVLEATISAFKAGIHPIQTPEPSEQLVARKESVVKAPKLHGIETAAEDSVDPSASVLSFGPDPDEYDPFAYEMGGLWKPVFRNAGAESPRNGQRRIDQILALEKLGVKSGEVSRSGRLDFRYLVANAMQAFTAQPLANQTHENPFTSPYLLATLIVPHLEPYFVIHNEAEGGKATSDATSDAYLCLLLPISENDNGASEPSIIATAADVTPAAERQPSSPTALARNVVQSALVR